MEAGAVDPSIDADGYANIQSEWADLELETQQMDRFLRKSGVAVAEGLEEHRTLADLIMAKIREKEQKQAQGEVEKEVLQRRC